MADAMPILTSTTERRAAAYFESNIKQDGPRHEEIMAIFGSRRSIMWLPLCGVPIRGVPT